MSYFELTLKMLMLGELTLLDLGGKKKKTPNRQHKINMNMILKDK